MTSCSTQRPALITSQPYCCAATSRVFSGLPLGRERGEGSLSLARFLVAPPRFNGSQIFGLAYAYSLRTRSKEATVRDSVLDDGEGLANGFIWATPESAVNHAGHRGLFE